MALKLKHQVRLYQLILINRIDLRDVLIAASGAQFIVNARGVTVMDGSNHGVGERVGDGRVKPFHVGGAFKEIGVQQIGIQRVLLDVLPIEARLPGALFYRLAIDLSQAGLF